VVPSNGEVLVMNNPAIRTSTADKMRKELKDLRAANRKEEKEKIKRLGVELERQKMNADLDLWKMITQVKAQMNNTIKSNTKTSSYDLRSIASIPDYYEYQNPKNARQKTNDKNSAWVVEYISAGGKEKDLLDAAAASRITTWKKIKWKRGTADTATAAPATPAPAALKNNVGAGGVG
jgi:hypothetical protein